MVSLQMKKSVLLAFKPRHIEFKNHVITITKAKGGRQRRVPIDGQTLAMLSDYISAVNIPPRIDHSLA